VSTSKTYSNSGVYVFNMGSLEKCWLDEHKVGKLEQGLLRSLAARKDLTALDNGDRYLLDIGTPERLMTARSQINSISRVFAV
jgi:NDP-sugar pyrophosphorylase family protein